MTVCSCQVPKNNSDDSGETVNHQLDICLMRPYCVTIHQRQEPIKIAKPKPKKPAEEQKKTEKAKVELKRKIPVEFQDFAESKTVNNT